MVQRSGDRWHVLIGEIGADRPRIIAHETLASDLDTLFEARGVEHVMCVLPAGSVVCRTCALPDADPAHLDQALHLQAEAHLLGVAPPHRLGMAVLDAAPAETTRTGLILAWPETASVARPPTSLPVTYVPTVAALAAITNGHRPSDPVLCLDRREGSIAIGLSHANGVAFRSTRERVSDRTSWSQHVGRILAETGMNVGHTDSFIDHIVEEAQRQIRSERSDDSTLLLPDELLNLAVSRLDGAPNDANWWAAQASSPGRFWRAAIPCCRSRRSCSTSLPTATLDDQVGEVRQAAAMALGKLGLIEGFAALESALTEGSPDLRFQAATSLVEIDADKAYPILIAALDDEGDGEVIGAIALALGAIGNADAVDPLRPKLDGIGQQGRFDIAYAFAQLGAEEAVTLLTPFADDKQYGWDALSALELVGDAKAAEVAAKVITSGRAVPIVELRATQCVLKSDANEGQRTSAKRALVGGLRHKKHEEKALAVELLGELGGAWAKAPLEQFASKWAGRKLREEAQEALAQIASRESS